jgi:hypothetical protein
MPEVRVRCEFRYFDGTEARDHLRHWPLDRGVRALIVAPVPT